MKRPVINGFFYAQKTTGVHRFARELMLELDKLVQEGELSVIVPIYSENLPEFKNLRLIKYGMTSGLMWEQIDLVKYLFENHTISISLCNSEPLLRPGIMCIHDAAYKTHPEYFGTLHGKLSVIWHRLNYRIAVWSRMPILTVSYFSKYSLVDTYHIKPDRIHVVGNGWQHMLRFEPDMSVLERNGLKSQEFYFTLGNINYNKNTNWVIEYAMKHPNDIFVLSGVRAKNSCIDIEKASNVRWLGYLSDEEITALYKSCKAFIFPSIHEGFGIPPMEALSQGGKIIVANTSCLPEIYKGTAHYIDAYDTNVNLDVLLREEVESPESVLRQYGWKQSAEKLKKIIDEFIQVGKQ